MRYFATPKAQAALTPREPWLLSISASSAPNLMHPYWRYLGFPAPGTTASPAARAFPLSAGQLVAAIVALLAFAAVWFAMLGQRVLVDPDEGRYATLALGMLRSGDWITPRLNGLLYFEKPPLQYWIGAAFFKVGGISEFTARLWPALAGFLTVLLLGWTAWRLWGRETGVRALAIAASTTWIIANSQFLTLDAGVTFFLTLTLCSVLLAQRPGLPAAVQRGWIWTAWAAMALAVLSKGLIGVLIPGTVLVLYSLWQRDFVLWRRLRWGSGALILLAIAVPWFVMVGSRNPGFSEFFFIHEHFGRYLTNQARREGAWWYFVPVLLLGFMPWTGALPWLLRRGEGAAAPVRTMLLCWAGFVFVFFSASGSKLPSYILPMFPALVLLAAHSLQHASIRWLRWNLLGTAAAWGLAGLTALYLLLRSPASPADQALVPLETALAAASVAWLASALWAGRLLSRGRVTAALVCVALTHMVAVLTVMKFHDEYGQRKSAAVVSRALEPYLERDTPVFAVRTYDQTLPFYLRRHVVLVAFEDEFNYGEQHEPGRWIPTVGEFMQRWKSLPRGAAYMTSQTWSDLRQAGLEGRVVFEDTRRVMIVKPGTEIR